MEIFMRLAASGCGGGFPPASEFGWRRWTPVHRTTPAAPTAERASAMPGTRLHRRLGARFLRARKPAQSATVRPTAGSSVLPVRYLADWAGLRPAPVARRTGWAAQTASATVFCSRSCLRLSVCRRAAAVVSTKNPRLTGNRGLLVNLFLLSELASHDADDLNNAAMRDGQASIRALRAQCCCHRGVHCFALTGRKKHHFRRKVNHSAHAGSELFRSS